ncbi:LOW QUALITY PROTEIN: B3_4 domain-containing protein/B5 domain-containing protein [Cephalotus follicularis]|uniref:phenylalanine--tRNA ligase n=1 Tax=Cephalotus follicularis TaxID=3775 RepID=A0A1Q3BH32_CEPFO|nr:LOW QUALITY PROTEIN: B3_4 domain-containing protein/B5 domain-containing protein [Cephalotus follicularis]
MPTVSVGRDRLFEALGRTYTQEEFEDLCFRFGIELDDVTTEKAIIRKEKHLNEEVADDNEEVIYKIEVPANRYDLLCLEGLAQALRIFNNQQDIPTHKVANISNDKILKMHVKKETSTVRPYIVCAVLRGITFDEARYNSFIDLQDKLHQNICRRRTLVAIGTHDLDTLQGPFAYEALPPPDINFVPLKQVKNFRADDLMKFYEVSPIFMLSIFLYIDEQFLCIGVVSSDYVTSTGNHMSNCVGSSVHIHCAGIFCLYICKGLYLVISICCILLSLGTYALFFVRLSHCHAALSFWFIQVIEIHANVDSIISSIKHQVTELLNRMQLRTEDSLSGDNQSNIRVSVPPTRSDVLHPCDVMEIARNGYTEVMTWVLCSYKENFAMLNRKDDNSAVIIENPRSSDFEVVRTSLMPGILKTVGHNKDHPKPIKIFEVGDVVLLDEKKDVGASNCRLFAALYCGANSGFELIHGLVDRVMEVMGIPFNPVEKDAGYHIQLSDEPEFLKGRQAKIIYREKRIGTFGIVHPEVLSNFDISDPCSFVELNIEKFL